MTVHSSFPEDNDSELSSLTDDEAVKLDMEDCPVDKENLDELVDHALNDFPEDVVQDEISEYAARIAQAHITKGTRDGHIRITKHFITFCKRRDPNWDPLRVDWRTPHDIRDFITQKCGSKEAGFEGRKFSTAISTRAALTFWYKTIRPDESVSEWRNESKTGVCSGLPTRSRVVSTFMVGLEKTKAKSGEVSQSARALTLDDMHRLHDECMAPHGKSIMEQRWGVVRYTAYLLGWLMFLRIDEVINLKFESIEIIPGERSYLCVSLETRKTAQTGVLHTWKLHANDFDTKICPVRTMIRLAVLYGETVMLSGPLFLRVSAAGAVMQSAAVTSRILSRALSKDLQNLGYLTWALYGTHSFRRGGCQHRIKNKGWTVDMVAAWGGWSQVEAITMFRYFYSPNDNHEFMDEYDRNDAKRARLSN